MFVGRGEELKETLYRMFISNEYDMAYREVYDDDYYDKKWW